ncbi:hypothetical protein AB4225_18900 [Streptomyces sp. 2RAF24]|uniref:hypothetical protein n=1 Tax=unclassified Streptomyces TaxID=2593676 RepID=UPI003411BD9A
MSIDPAEFAARLRAERDDPERAEKLRLDRVARRRKLTLWAGAGALVLGGFVFWLAQVTEGERPANEPFAPGLLQEAMWPPEWPVTEHLPFRNSPAAGWPRADLADGLHPPRAEPVAHLSEERVAQDLETVRTFLREAHTSDEAVTGARPDRALALLAPGDARGDAEDALTRPGPGRDPLRTFTRFDPAEVLVLEDVRARGSMTYEAAPAGGLLVHTDYTFVYAVIQTEGGWEITRGRQEAARVVVRRQLDLTVRPDRKLVLGPAAYLVANDDCAVPDDGYLHPLFSKAAAKAKEQARAKGGASFDPYAPGARLPVPAPGSCPTPTRT